MIGQNLRLTGPSKQEWANFGTMFKNAGLAAWDTITTPFKAAANSSYFNTEPTNVYSDSIAGQLKLAYNNNDTRKINELHEFLDKNGMTYNADTNKIYKHDGTEITGNVVVGQMGGGFNWGHTLENTKNLLGVGLSGWDLYQNISTYGDRKDLLKATKENVQLKNQQLKADMENMAKERARLDTMRSNAVAQRSGSSSISGW